MGEENDTVDAMQEGANEFKEEFIDKNDVEEMIELGQEKEREEHGEEQSEQMKAQAAQESLQQELEQLQTEDDSSMGFFEHKDSIYSVHLNPADQNMCVSGDGDDQAYVWNVTDGKVLYHLKGHTDSVISCSFSADGKYVATGSMDATIRVYSSTDGTLVSVLEGPSSDVEWFKWHPKGAVITAGTEDASVWMWNAVTGACMRVFGGHIGTVTCGTWCSGGKMIGTGGSDGSVYIWSPKTGQAAHHLAAGKMFHDGAITSLAAHPTAKLLLSGSQDRTANLINVDSGKVLATFKGHEDGIEAVGFCNQMKLCSTASLDGTLKIWDMSTGALRGSCSHAEGLIQSKWHPTQPYVYTCGLDKTVRMWDARSATVVKQWRGHRDVVMDLTVANDGSFVATASDDNTSLVFRC